MSFMLRYLLVLWLIIIIIIVRGRRNNPYCHQAYFYQFVYQFVSDYVNKPLQQHFFLFNTFSQELKTCTDFCIDRFLHKALFDLFVKQVALRECRYCNRHSTQLLQQRVLDSYQCLDQIFVCTQCQCMYSTLIDWTNWQFGGGKNSRW